MAHRQIIQNSLETLSDLTNISERFMDKLVELKIITYSEKECLEGIGSRYSKSRAFYDILRRKDEAVFLKTIEVMQQDAYRQSSDVLDILGNQIQAQEVNQTSPSKHEDKKHSTEFSQKEIKLRDASWIANILSSRPDTTEKRELIYGLLDLPPGELFDLTQKARGSGSDSYTFFSGCINKFISLNVGASFADLHKLLATNFPSVMNEIVHHSRAN